MLKRGGCKFSIVALVLIAVVACSTQEDKFMNRNFHAMTTYYNILYHGNIEMKLGVEVVKRNYPDHFFEILPIERMAEVPEDRNDTVPLVEHFGNAEDKAAKGIRKHSMFLGGREYNYQIDEAYLLLGQARYYDQRFIPAKDAFLYIRNHYPNSEILTRAEIWLEKTNFRMGFPELALENLKALLAETSVFEPQDLAEINATLASIYLNLIDYEEEEDEAVLQLNQSYYKLAIDALAIAIEHVKAYENKERWQFIRAQLFTEIGEKDSAYSNFQKTIDYKRKAMGDYWPIRDYWVNSLTEQFKIKDYGPENDSIVKEKFEEWETDWENRHDLDHFYFEYAQHYLKIDSIDLAIDYYNKSLRQPSQNQYRISRNYLNLAEIYFDKASYKTAGAYYDSTLTNLDDSTREFRLIRKKRDNLEDVIKYEDIAQETDSIIDLVNMNDQERLVFFEKYTKKLKNDAESLFAQQKKQERLAMQQAPEIPGFGGASAVGNKGGQTFHFYDDNKLKSGIGKFKSIWGDIEFADNWRFKPQKKGKSKGSDEEEASEDDFFSSPEFDPQTYISQIPEDETVIDSIKGDRNYAYFQLGVIYKEKFKELALAEDRFIKLVGFNAVDEKLLLPAKYNLYLLYKLLGDEEQMDFWKANIINEHPDSRYAEILINPRSMRDGENSPNSIYSRLYKEFKNQNIEYVIDECNFWIDELMGTALVPKFKVLKAMAVGRLYGHAEYLKLLDEVALDHSQTKEGKKAKEMYEEAKKQSKKGKFIAESKEELFNLVYVFPKQDYDQAFLKQVYASIREGLEEVNYQHLKTSIDIYNDETNFLVVRNLTSKLGAEGLGDVLKEKGFTSQDWEYFSVEKQNYTKIQFYKSLNSYLENQ